MSFLIGKYTKMGMDAIVHHLDRLDNAKDGLEENVAGILDDQSAAEKDMAELRAEQDWSGRSWSWSCRSSSEWWTASSTWWRTCRDA